MMVLVVAHFDYIITIFGLKCQHGRCLFVAAINACDWSSRSRFRIELCLLMQDSIHINYQIVVQPNLNMNNPKLQVKDNFDIEWMQQKDTRCWIYQPNENQGDIYVRGTLKGCVPLAVNRKNSRISGITENGTPFEARAHQIERCRDSHSLERDLIEMDIINAPEVLIQLKRRLAQHKIHTCLWNSLIILNPFKFITEQYSDKTLSTYFEHIFLRREDIRKLQPHIFSFTFSILSDFERIDRTQVVSISGESGSGKTEANKQALRAISYCSSRVQNIKGQSNLETKVLKCDPILQVFGNAKTIKNDNSSRFGKLVTLKFVRQSMHISHSTVKNYFLEKSRIISQSPGQRNFHVFYQLISFATQEQRAAFKLKNYRHADFNYISQRLESDRQMTMNDKEMWDDLNQALISLNFSKEFVHEIWSIVSAILLLGNIGFDNALQNQNQSCEIKNIQIAENVAYLLGMDPKEFAQALVTHRRTIAGELVLSPLTKKQCSQGRDSMAKALYQSLFQWLVEELNRKLNHSESTQQKSVSLIKLLDIYGFEIFDYNSFEQLCVNYTNEKIHQIYLEQVFMHEKNVLKKEGLEGVISRLNFTDNIKIIELLQSLNKSIFNLLDESCSVNVKDDDFLANIRKHHDQHDHFPPSNNINMRKSFIIKHTPGDIQYMAEGFRDKNKDLIREDIVSKLSKAKLRIISQSFQERAESLKQEANKKFLGVKIRKQVKELITEMSTNTDLHFIRCIKPNEKKLAFTFVDRVCYNQIKYLGILDTVQMRKDSYHIRISYAKFYLKYGILENRISNLINIKEAKISQPETKEITMRFITNYFVNYTLDYQFGKERIFLKMATQNVLDTLLNKKLRHIELAATMIKVHYKRAIMSKRRRELLKQTKKVQKAVNAFLKIMRHLRKKKAVRIIEEGWIKYHETFFARKKRPNIMKLQKYIRTKIDELQVLSKIQAIRRAKFLLFSLSQGNILSQRIQIYRTIKEQLRGQIYDGIWLKMSNLYKSNLQKYLHGAAIIRQNSKAISKAEESTNYRLNIKYRKQLQIYIRSYLDYARYATKNRSILIIQSYFRMFKVRHKYLSLRKTVVKIQRNWRKYHFDKLYNYRFTEQYFNRVDQEDSIRNETQYWKDLLHRDYSKSSKSKSKGVQSILFNNQKIKMDKINLFYYLLDFEILAKLSNTYPGCSWVENYYTLYEQAWQKGNPIQIVQVSDESTVCATISKVYTWGNYSLEDFIEGSQNRFKTIQSLNLPSNRLEKIHAHNKFTIIDIENQDPIIIGNQKLYQEDSSNKEWKTLNESFVVIHGIVLTLKRVQFSRVPVNEKIVQMSCGMYHCIAKTSLKKVYTWGENNKGQLGLTHFRRARKPRLIDYLAKHVIVVQQVAASAYSCLVLDANCRIWWWGSNGTINMCSQPKECLLFQKSQFIDNPQKYSVVRVLPSWSKSISLIGVTVACHEGIFKSSQNNIKRKSYQYLMTKWNQDITTITPPFIQSISGYFQQRLMPKVKQRHDDCQNKEAQNQRIRQKLLAQIMLMEQAQRTLLKQKKRY